MSIDVRSARRYRSDLNVLEIAARPKQQPAQMDLFDAA